MKNFVKVLVLLFALNMSAQELAFSIHQKMDQKNFSLLYELDILSDNGFNIAIGGTMDRHEKPSSHLAIGKTFSNNHFDFTVGPMVGIMENVFYGIDTDGRLKFSDTVSLVAKMQLTQFAKSSKFLNELTPAWFLGFKVIL